jgi:hypothetical protein
VLRSIDVIWPVPALAMIAAILGVVLVLWWLSRARVTRIAPPVAMMVQRIVFPSGVRPADATNALVQLDKPDELVIPFEHAILVIDYPLTEAAEIPISAPLPIGFTRAALVKAICDEYAHVYDAEEGTASIKTVPIDERGSVKTRNRTDGAYGIWGHDLEDLVVTAANWTREVDGKVKIQLHVES